MKTSLGKLATSRLNRQLPMVSAFSDHHIGAVIHDQPTDTSATMPHRVFRHGQNPLTRLFSRRYGQARWSSGG